MENFRCNKCRVEILNFDKCCRICGLIGVEYKFLEVMFDNDTNNAKYLQTLIEDGFNIINKKQIIHRTDEMNFLGIEYELQRPV